MATAGQFQCCVADGNGVNSPVDNYTQSFYSCLVQKHCKCHHCSLANRSTPPAMNTTLSSAKSKSHSSQLTEGGNPTVMIRVVRGVVTKERAQWEHLDGRLVSHEGPRPRSEHA